MTTEDEQSTESNKKNARTSKGKAQTDDKTDHKEEDKRDYKETSMIEMRGDDIICKEKGTKRKECDISKSNTPKLKKPKQEVDEDKKSSQLPENKDTGKDKADGSDISPNNSECIKCKDRLSKHLCNKCGIYFDTTCILTKHINKFHKFDQSDEDNDDLQVIYDDNEKPAFIKDFHIEINDNICGECGLKLLTGKMLKKHNAKHHPK